MAESTTARAASEEQFLTLKELCKRYSIALSTGYAHLKSGQFPKPFKLGSRANRWALSTIEKWEAEQMQKAEQG